MRFITIFLSTIIATVLVAEDAPLAKVAFHFSNIPNHPTDLRVSGDMLGPPRCAPWCDVRSGDIASFVMLRGGQQYATATIVMAGPPSNFRIVVIAPYADIVSKVPLSAYMTRTTWNGGGTKMPEWAVRINAQQWSTIPGDMIGERVGVRVFDPAKDAPPRARALMTLETVDQEQESVARVIGSDVYLNRKPIVPFGESVPELDAVTTPVSVRPDTIPVDVIAIPIGFDPTKFRMNVYVLTPPACTGVNDRPHTCFPAQSWNDPVARAALQIDEAGGMLWLRTYKILRDGRTLIPVGAITLPAAPLQSRQIAVPEDLLEGEKFAIQWKPVPGLFVWASMIDRRSDDTSNVPSVVMTVNIPMR